VEDQPPLADDIADSLCDQGMAADVAYHGASGLDKKLMNHYDVVIVDRDLPRSHAQNRSIWPSPALTGLAGQQRGICVRRGQ